MMANLYCGRDRAVIRGGDGVGDGGYIDDSGVAHGIIGLRPTTANDSFWM